MSPHLSEVISHHERPDRFPLRLPQGRCSTAHAVVAALVLKLCVVVAMRIFLFGADARPTITEAALTQHLGPAAAVRLP